MAGNNVPFWFQQFRDSSGRVLENGYLYTFVTETNIPKPVYYDFELTQPASNPVLLDSAGYVPEIFLEVGLYTFELRDKNNVLVVRRDNINSLDFGLLFRNLGGAYLPLSGGNLTGFVSGTSIAVSGGISASNMSTNVLEIPNVVEIKQSTKRNNSIKINGNSGPYSEYASTIGFGEEDTAVVGTLDGNSLTLSGSFVEILGANTYVKDGNFIVGEFAEPNVNTLQNWGVLDQRGDAIFDGTLSAKNGVIIPGKGSSDILLADGSTINVSDISGSGSNYFSTGSITATLPDIIDNLNGSCTISDTVVSIYDNSNFTGELRQYAVFGGIFGLTEGAEEYICVKYNSGNPIMYVETDKNNINESDVIRLYTVWRQGFKIHSIGADSKGLGLANKLSHMEDCTVPYKKTVDGGLILSETSSPIDRVVTVTSGNVYAGVIRIPVSAMSSYTDTLTLAYKNAGVWTYNDMPAYNNTQYSDGTNLQTLGVEKYSPRWFYRSIGDAKQLFYVMGGQYNSVAEAKAELPPGDLSKLVKNHCILIARIIIKQNDASGIVDNISDTNLNFSSVQNHNDLGNIQGGSIGNYYHVSATTFGYLSGVSADIQEQIDSKADISAVPTISDLNSFLPLSGGTMGGSISARDLVPASSFTYDLGKTGKRWGSLFCRVLTANAVSTTNYDMTSRIKLILGDADNVGTGGQLQFRKRSTFYAPDAVSGDFYSDGNKLHFYDESKTPRTLAYTSDVANYLPLSGGTLSGQLNLLPSMPLRFTQTGSGTYNLGVWYHTSAGTIYERARLSDSLTATPIKFAIGTRGSESNIFEISNIVGISARQRIYYDALIDSNTDYAENCLEVATNTSSPSHSFKPGIGFHSQGQYASLFYLNAQQDWKAKDNSGNIITFYHTGNLPSVLGNYLPLAGGTMTGDISFTNSTTGLGKGIYGTNGDNDHWRIVGGSTGTDGGYLEIATDDNQIEPIYVRQYQGPFASPVSVRTLTLLDQYGNTTFPGNISAYGSVSGSSLVTNQALNFRNSSSAFGAFVVGTHLFRFINYNYDGTEIDYPLEIEKTGLNRIFLGTGAIKRPVQMGGPVTIQNLSANGFVRSNSSGLLTSSPLVSGDIPNLPYIPTSGGNVPGADFLTISTTANTDSKKISMKDGWSGGEVGMFTDTNWILKIGTEMPSSEIVVINSYLSASTISANSIVISGGTSNQFLKADGSSDSNNYRYTLYSSAYALSAVAGGTPRQVLNYNLPAGILNTRSVLISFKYAIANSASHTAYISTSVGGLTYTDSTLGLGSGGAMAGTVTMQYDALVSGASGKVGQNASVVGKYGTSDIITNQDYIGSEQPNINLNNSVNITINLVDNNGSSVIYVYQPLIEIL